MAVHNQCQACGKSNLEQARFCEDCGQSLQTDQAAISTVVAAQVPAYVSTYVSTYQVARSTAQFISAVGWIIFALSLLVFAGSFLGGMSSAARGYGPGAGIAGLFSLSSLGGAIGGLILVGFGQSSRALVDTADFTGEMLAIMKTAKASERQ
jgi:hypothetical protein